MRKWLARLSFSFLIVAGVLAWEGYKYLSSQRPVQKWRVGLYFLGAGVSLSLALRGVRERHRDRDPGDPPA